MFSKISHTLNTKRIDDIYIQTKDLRINLNFELVDQAIYSFDDKNQLHLADRHNSLTIKENKVVDWSHQNNILFIIVKGL